MWKTQKKLAKYLMKPQLPESYRTSRTETTPSSLETMRGALSTKTLLPGQPQSQYSTVEGGLMIRKSKEQSLSLYHANKYSHPAWVSQPQRGPRIFTSLPRHKHQHQPLQLLYPWAPFPAQDAAQCLVSSLSLFLHIRPSRGVSRQGKHVHSSSMPVWSFPLVSPILTWVNCSVFIMSHLYKPEGFLFSSER